MVKVGGRYCKHTACSVMLPGHRLSVSTNKKLWTCREKTRMEIVTNWNGGKGMRGKLAGGQTCSKYFLLFLHLNVMYAAKFDCV